MRPKASFYRRWCIRHRDGWCAHVSGRKDAKPSAAAFNLPTLCEQFVTLPWGIEWRTPTCETCLEYLRQDEAGWRANHERHPREARRA